jgi:uncharacterized protein (TIGR00297 family)
LSEPAAPPDARLGRGELLRKSVHIAVGSFALLLRDLTWPQAALMAVAACVFNWQVLPRLGGRKLWRDAEHGAGYPLGILLYPLSVLALILVLRHDLWMAAAIWGVLAWGDGMASLVGMGAGGPRLPWNPRKGWAGLVAFVLFGTVASALLIAWTLHMPLRAWASPWILGLALPLSLVCALVESLPSTLDDNLTVPLAGLCVLPLFAVAQPILLLDPGLSTRVAQGLVINGLFAALAFFARSIDVPGALSAVLIGTVITAGLGLPGLALMVTFFVVGSTVTRVGYRIKAQRGIAQEKGGARGWRNAWANGGVPAFLALMAGITAREDHVLLVLAYAASVATAAADTCSSEIGKAYGRRTFLITTFRAVPPGTEGAVSLEGTLGGLVGGMVVGGIGALVGLYGAGTAAFIGIIGLLGSFAESYIGTAAERRGWMGNDLLNALNTAIGGALAFLLARTPLLASLMGVRP